MAFFKLGAFADKLTGKVGNSVFVETAGGVVVRDRVIPSNPKTAAQQGVRSNFTKAAHAFKSMTSTQVESWNQYASQFTTRTKGGKLRKKAGINVFVALASKFLQVTPTGTIPLTVPASSFSGDNLTFTVASDTGLISVTASGPNTSGTTTEFLVQRLANPNRKAEPEAYKHSTFHTFASGALGIDIALSAGYWALAYRYVKTATGQETDLQVLPVTQVTFAVAEGGSNKKSKAA